MKTYIIYMFSIATIMPLLVHAQFYNTEIEATINLKFKGKNMLHISGFAQNHTEVEKSLRYVLSVIKANKKSTNNSSNDQEGRIVLQGGDKENLSTTVVNVDDRDKTIILLLIYDGEDKLLGKDRYVLQGSDIIENEVSEKDIKAHASDVQEGEADGFILRGMVLEDTKTKAGNDFYDFYYAQYLAKNIQGEETVKITEKLAIANNTQIEINVGEDVILQFIVNPRSQYIEDMASQAIYRTIAHFQDKRKTQNEITRY